MDLMSKFNQGVAFFYSDKFDSSISIFSKLENENFALPQVYYMLAQNYLHKFQILKKSINLLNYSAELTSFPERKRLFDLAFEYCRKCIILYEFNDANSFFTMGQILAVSGDFESSALNFFRAKKLGDPEAILELEKFKKLSIGLTKWHDTNMTILDFIEHNLSNYNGKFKF